MSAGSLEAHYLLLATAVTTSNPWSLQGSCKSWHCASIEVGSTLDGSVVVFPCNSWFGKGKGDGHVERDLYPEGSPQAMVQVPYKVRLVSWHAAQRVTMQHMRGFRESCLSAYDGLASTRGLRSKLAGLCRSAYIQAEMSWERA